MRVDVLDHGYDLSHAVEFLQGHVRALFPGRMPAWWGHDYGRLQVRVLRSYVAALRVLKRQGARS